MARIPLLAIAVFVIALSVALVAYPVAQATAYASCVPYNYDSSRTNDYLTHYFDGWVNHPKSGGTVGGTYASIDNENPYVYQVSGKSDIVTAWTMINVGGVEEYAQIGWLEWQSGGRNTFDEWTHDGTFTQHTFPPEPQDQYTTYTVLYGYQPGDFTFQLADKTIDTAAADFTPNEGQQYGELWTKASQMPGSTTGHEDFNDSHIYYGGIWQGFDGTQDNGGHPQWFGNSYENSESLDIWDVDCP